MEKDGKIIIAMPGPPAEMNRMWDEEVAPELLRRAPGTVLITRTLKSTGIGEGMVDEMLSPLLKSTNPSIGLYARRTASTCAWLPRPTRRSRHAR